jgi:hypothetical protein
MERNNFFHKINSWICYGDGAEWKDQSIISSSTYVDAIKVKETNKSEIL